ncbi:hypothetical protein [Zoogloea sp.]|uniref:hypothetical protein n=1 Tax=Zoogloea sp. TaxID=49181 RepID=UPI002621D47F|nr:hypothetical protein [Zoogloea sp.]MDD3354836.1 hypothetical protein [Zoogloea sp.]
MSLDELVRLSRQGRPVGEVLDIVRRTGTHHPLTPSEILRLREQGVAPEVLDELVAAQVRFERDQAAAERVRQAQAQAATVDRARSEAYRRGWEESRWFTPWGSAWSSSVYLNFGHPFGHSFRYPGRGGVGWGIRFGR